MDRRTAYRSADSGKYGHTGITAVIRLSGAGQCRGSGLSVCQKVEKTDGGINRMYGMRIGFIQPDPFLYSRSLRDAGCRLLQKIIFLVK